MTAATARGSPSTEEEVREAAPSAVKALLDEADTFCFDCDGTLYQAGTLLPHVAEAIAYLRRLRKKIFFITNTSSRSREQLSAKICGLGVDCSSQECIPSCTFTADHIKRTHPDARRVYVIGGQGLVDELAQVGIESTGGPSEDRVQFSENEFTLIAEEIGRNSFDGVVVGWDTGLTYHKIAKAALVFQQHPGAFFYATNDDAADRVGKWRLPGNGPLLKAIESACAGCAPFRLHRAKPFGVEAEVLGKPNPAYARRIAEWSGVDLRRAVMVGDRLDTDILMGQRAGMRSLFVLSGVDSLREVEETGIRPDFILPGVGDLWSSRPGSTVANL